MSNVYDGNETETGLTDVSAGSADSLSEDGSELSDVHSGDSSWEDFHDDVPQAEPNWVDIRIFNELQQRYDLLNKIVSDNCREITKIKADDGQARAEYRRVMAENNKLEAQKRVYESAWTTLEHGPDLKQYIDIDSIAEFTVCGICTQKMWKPTVLQCGHVYCRDCVQRWFLKQKEDFVLDNPGLDGIFDPDSELPHPFFSCMGCGQRILLAPAECAPIASLVHAVTLRTEAGIPISVKLNGYQQHDWSTFFA